MTTIVTWVKDSNNRYEVSSVEHLKQLMSRGTLYTNSGPTPTANQWWGSSTIPMEFIQTVDIDLLGDSTDIKPIGTEAYDFYGNYDGGNFKISNWSYVDPNFTGTSDCESRVGLFGQLRTDDPCVLKNIRLTGVWTIQGYDESAGFLLGYSNNNGTEIINVEVDVDPGSSINYRAGDTPSNVGGIGGFCRGNLTGLTLKGTLELNQPDANNVGGVIGFFGNYGTLFESSLIQNIATFPSGISGNFVGGIFGKAQLEKLAKVINAMNGDINGSGSYSGAGGFCGYMGNAYITSNGDVHTIINSMNGDITTPGASGTGGMVGISEGSVHTTYSKFINYMNGNIVTSTNRGAGMVGTFNLSGMTMTNSINAMNGSAYYSAIGNTTFSSGADIFIDTSFGFSFTTSRNGSSNAPSGFLTSTDIPELPYATLDGTDTEGNSYDFNFVYANLAGNSSYSTYTHLILHKGDIYSPFSVDFVIPENSTTLYATFANVNTDTFLQPSLSIVVVTSVLVPRSINIPVSILEVSGAISYQITYEGPTGGEITALSGVTTLEHNITGVDPETTYTVRLYTDTGSGYTLTEELTATTLPNVSANYNVEDLTENGVIDLSSLPEDTISNINEVMAELFTTGDIVSVSVSDKLTSFINLGDTLSIKEISGVLLPFEVTSGTGQDVSVILSDDTTTISINYDDTVNTITVEGVVYYPGDSFILDGKKVTVIEY